MKGNRGFALVMVLIITGIGLLFGAGALLLFRFQCQLRIDRQHELEKVYAIRSALNWVKKNAILINADTGNVFRYHTDSGRDLKIIVKPVVPIFPNHSYDAVEYKHRMISPSFVMERDDIGDGVRGIPRDVAAKTNGYYNSAYDYECGAYGMTNLLIATEQYTNFNKDQSNLLSFGDVSVTNGVRLWVNIGMRNAGGWQEDAYGRRYYFYPRTYAGDQSCRDIMRLCLIRDVVNDSKDVGYRHGWPLSLNGEKALVIQCQQIGTSSEADMRLYEYEYGRVPTLVTNYTISATYQIGIQLAGKNVSLFYIDQAKQSVPGVDISASYGFIFKPDMDENLLCMSDLMYEYFGKPITLYDDKVTKSYEGTITNLITQDVYAPDMRAVFEVEAASEARGLTAQDKLTDFRVEPAYKFDVYIEYPVGVTNRATIAQLVGSYKNANKDTRTVVTYDTHGTENKGFRKDERLWAEAQKRK